MTNRVAQLKEVRYLELPLSSGLGGEAISLFNADSLPSLGMPRSFRVNYQVLTLTDEGALYGIHGGPLSQLVAAVTRGSKMQVLVVDGRPQSSTVGRYTEVFLTYGYAIFIPPYCGYAALTLSDIAYSVTGYDAFPRKDKEDWLHVHPFDPDLDLDWRRPRSSLILDEDDRKAGSFSDYARRRRITNWKPK